MKLTAGMRYGILEKLMKHGFDGMQDNLTRSEQKLAADIYNDVISDTIKGIVLSLPPGWLPTVSAVTASFDDHSGNSAYHELELPFELSVPYYKYHGCMIRYPAAHPYSKRYRNLMQAKTDLQTAKSKARAMAKSTLSSFTTVEGLVRFWPEVARFVNTAPVKANLPAVRSEELVQVFGLNSNE